MLLEPRTLACAAPAELDTDAIRDRDSGMSYTIYGQECIQCAYTNHIEQGGSWHTCMLRNCIRRRWVHLTRTMINILTGTAHCR
jgi:hypothetical protein